MASGVDIGAILGLQADFQLDSMISLSFTSFQAVIVAIVAKLGFIENSAALKLQDAQAENSRLVARMDAFQSRIESLERAGCIVIPASVTQGDATDLTAVWDALHTKANAADMQAALQAKVDSTDLAVIWNALRTKADAADAQTVMHTDLTAIWDALSTKADATAAQPTDSTDPEISLIRAELSALKEAMETKVDVDDVRDALGTKVDMEDFSDALSTKAERSDVARKADASELYEALARLREGFEEPPSSEVDPAPVEELAKLRSRLAALSARCETLTLDIRALQTSKADRPDLESLHASMAELCELAASKTDHELRAMCAHEAEESRHSDAQVAQILSDIRGVLSTKADLEDVASVREALRRAAIHVEPAPVVLPPREWLEQDVALRLAIESHAVALRELQQSKASHEDIIALTQRVQTVAPAAVVVTEETVRDQTALVDRLHAQIMTELDRIRREHDDRLAADGQRGQWLTAQLDSRLDLLGQQLRAKADRGEIRRLEAQIHYEAEHTPPVDRGALTRAPVVHCLSCDRALPRFRWDTREISIPTNTMPVQRLLLPADRRPGTSPLREMARERALLQPIHGLAVTPFAGSLASRRSAAGPSSVRTMPMGSQGTLPPLPGQLPRYALPADLAAMRPLLQGEFDLRGRDGVMYKGREDHGSVVTPVAAGPYGRLSAKARLLLKPIVR